MTLYEIVKPIVDAHNMGLSLDVEVLRELIWQLIAKLPENREKEIDG